MKIDVVSIFPDYLSPLELSLPGKARDKGLVDIAVHDLRTWTHDRHRTVDDSPYGGGAGIVMKPEPWGQALDELTTPESVVLFTTPSGEPFSQTMAAELAAEPHLVFACGRYEGIDQRVIDHARSQGRVREISLGDYVLNGGEVAALAVTEAVIRLLPGFMGNAESLTEESHNDGLLEYPVYTKPRTWREHSVPDVLLSGDHARIADWRHEQRVERTARRRPDLLPAGSVANPDGIDLQLATAGDAGEIFTMQRACWLTEMVQNPGVEIPPLIEDLGQVQTWLGEWTVLVARRGTRLVAAARGKLLADDQWAVGRLMVAPDLQGHGLGRWMLERIEAAAPLSVRGYELVTGAGSAANLRLYKKAGYRSHGSAGPGTVRMEKKRKHS